MIHSKHSGSGGFTLLEILIALFIMSFGFISLSQMEYLSLRQKQLAAQGTDATNVVQFISDMDLAEIKRIYLLNSQIFLDELNDRGADYTYCNGSSNASVCSTCPCDPLEALSTNPTNGSDVTQCAVVELDNFDLLNILYFTDTTSCLSDYDALGADAMFVVKRAQGSQSNTVITIDVTYAAKTLEQFRDTGMSVALGDNLVVQGISISAQISDFSDTVPLSSGNWSTVRIPHIP